MMGMRATTWVIKASQLDNQSADRTARWQRIMASIKAAGDIIRGAASGSLATIVLHGGASPWSTAELHEVARLKREIFAGQAQLILQADAPRITAAMVELLLELGIGVSVSCGAAGDDEGIINFHLDALRAAGLCHAGIVELGAQTSPELRKIYDWYARRALGIQLIPRSNEDISGALCELFDHWLTTGAEIEVAPFGELIAYVAQHLLGIQRRPYDRGIDGDKLLVVDIRGDLFHGVEPGAALGNLWQSSMIDILAAEPYWAGVRAERERRAMYCARCEYASSCGGEPLQPWLRADPRTGRCPIYYRVLKFIEAYLTKAEFDKDDLAQLLQTHAGASLRLDS
jgi:hypothetical protein